MDPLERLLSQMPAIAKAVNEFTSEDVQKQAFQALLRAAEGAQQDGIVAGNVVREGEEQDTEAAPPSRRAPRKATVATGDPVVTRTARRRASGPSVTYDKTLNLRPAGLQSFEDFVAEKKPSSDHERNLIAVYYLTRIAEVTATIDRVYTCYKDRGWRVPTNLRNALPLTAAKKGWLITKNLNDLKVAVPGENYVEHDLPAKPNS